MHVRWLRTNSRRSDGSMSRSVGAVNGSGTNGSSVVMSVTSGSAAASTPTAGVGSGVERRLQRLVAPLADAIVATVVGPGLLDRARAVPELELEARGRDHVEAEHLVVLVLAERIGDRQPCVERSIERAPDIVLRHRLEHDVMQLLGERDRSTIDA